MKQDWGRKIIYLLVLLTLSVPLINRYSLTPVRMVAAEKLYSLIESLPTQPDKIVYLALDFGPSTIAENGSQAQVIIEHLFRRRIHFAVTAQIPEAVPVLNTLPDRIAQRLMKQDPSLKLAYGQDWVNLGYTAGTSLTIQSIPKASDIVQFFKKDVRGNNLSSLPAFNQVHTLENISALIEITGSTGTLESYLQFFQTDKYRPVFAHGCTSIVIPQAFIYLDSGQLAGLLEGIAGGAWYGHLLNERYPGRAVDDSLVINTGLGVAHLLIIALILAGNIVGWRSRRARA